MFDLNVHLRRRFDAMRRAVFACLLASAGLAVALPAAAQVTYTYTGNPFTLFSCGPSIDLVTGTVTGTALCATPGPNVNTSYLGTDRVTATLSLTSPLPANQALVDVRNFPGFALSMSDGRHPVTNLMAIGMFAEIATDASGNITTWRLVINTGGVDNGGISTTKSTFVSDGGTLRCCDPTVDGDLARVGNSPGVWTSPPSSPSAATSALITVINTTELGLTVGQVASLTDKLNNVQASIAAGLNKQAINQLNAFINSVDTAQKTGKMIPATAATLIAAANAIIALL
jgi:hypothetical protein